MLVVLQQDDTNNEHMPGKRSKKFTRFEVFNTGASKNIATVCGWTSRHACTPRFETETMKNTYR